jgi:hypothetical protein
MSDYEMTNDLRDFFNSVALQRPAEGELDRVIEATRAVRPRPAWPAQLAQVAGTVGWPASAALRYAVWLALLLLMLALLSVGFAGLGRPPAPPGSGPFEGRWVAADVADGSDMVLVVADGKKPSVRYEDLYASACLTNGDKNTHWISAGSGTVVGDTLSVFYNDGGGCTTWHIDPYVDAFTLDSEGDTLADTYGNTWHRPTR